MNNAGALKAWQLLRCATALNIRVGLLRSKLFLQMQGAISRKRGVSQLQICIQSFRRRLAVASSGSACSHGDTLSGRNDRFRPMLAARELQRLLAVKRVTRHVSEQLKYPSAFYGALTIRVSKYTA